jgi:ABC-type sugar transport system ATPase subunit
LCWLSRACTAAATWDYEEVVTLISVESLCIRAGSFRLDDINFQVPSGGYGVLMGKTGSGKTTILESIIGLRTVACGRIVLHQRDVTWLKPAVRGIGYVPQDGALFSKMNVAEQIGLALTIRRVPKDAVKQRVDELAELLGIAHLLHRRPRGLSGGERQRVALGRALSFRPSVLCLDEPLSALDDDTRHQMCQLLDDIRRRTGVTTLHITHNLHEAEALADCVFRLENGRIETAAAPQLLPPSDAVSLEN